MMSNKVADQECIFNGKKSRKPIPHNNASPRIGCIICKRARLSEKHAHIWRNRERLAYLERRGEANGGKVDRSVQIRDIDTFGNGSSKSLALI